MDFWALCPTRRTFFRVNIWNEFKHKDTFSSCKLAGDWSLDEHAKVTEIYENIDPWLSSVSIQSFLKIRNHRDEIDKILSKEKRYEYKNNLLTLESKKFIVKGSKSIL